MHILYEAQEKPMIARYMATDYAYLHNLQGDVVGILDMNGATVVDYAYDACKIPTYTKGSMAETLSVDNPFHPVQGGCVGRGDRLYDLRSRYDNPRWGGFVNADTFLGEVGIIFGHNIFTYCKNTPIVFRDPSGQIERKAWYAGIVEWVANIIPSLSNQLKSPHYGEDERTLALNHPLAAIKGDQYKEIASRTTDAVFGHGVSSMDGTVANASKHAYWNALMTYDFGASLAEKFANAHEAPYNSQLDEEYLGTTIGAHCKMDYYYHSIGRDIGQRQFPKNMATYHFIAQAVLSAVVIDTSQVLIWDSGFTIVDDLQLGLKK